MGNRHNGLRFITASLERFVESPNKQHIIYINKGVPYSGRVMLQFGQRIIHNSRGDTNEKTCETQTVFFLEDNMGIGVLVLGESGTGKSTSLRNFKGEEVSIINVEGKPFPFKSSFTRVVNTDRATDIINLVKATKSKRIVIDDAQYIMANEFMRRSGERGFDKFTEIGVNFFNVVDVCKSLPNDCIVYFLMHTEESTTGSVKAKTIGKMLDEKISLEGKFSIVLRTKVQDGKYFFSTQNNGFDTVKSPMGMFPPLIENDLKKVDETIRTYYGL